MRVKRGEIYIAASGSKRIVMRISKDFSVASCINRCPFYGSSRDGMVCLHPYFDNKGAYDNMIISHNNQPIPEKCPLRLGKLEVTSTYTLKA